MGVLFVGEQLQPFLEVKELKKSFGHIEALKGASLQAKCGEVLAIVGDNGAGKSTLIKTLSGALTPDSGSIIVDGKEYGHLTPKLAGDNGISTVYQDLSLVNTQTVWENIFLGHEYRNFGWLNKKKMRREAAELLNNLNISIHNHEEIVGNLSGGQRQAIAVARAIHHGGKMIILDEPTAAMGLRETAATQQLIKNLAVQGYGVIIISHNIQQVFELSDRICVMRQGQVLALVDTKSVTSDDIVSMIVSGTSLNGAIQ